MITMDVVDWLASQEIGGPGKFYHVYQGPNGPTTEPKPHIVITPIPGGAINCEGALETTVYQFKVVGPQGTTSQTINEQARVAERLARDVDRLMLTTRRPVFGLSQVIFMDRLGGGPSGSPWDKAKRYYFTCTYQIQAESELNP